MARSLARAGAQLLLVCGVGAKFLADRATLPRVWVETVPVDPDSLFQERYVHLRLRVRDGSSDPRPAPSERVALKIENGQLVAYPSPNGIWAQADTPGNRIVSDAVSFYIPEHVPDPSRRKGGQQLWVEVSVPSNELPRPIRLGLKTEGAPITELK